MTDCNTKSQACSVLGFLLKFVALLAVAVFAFVGACRMLELRHNASYGQPTLAVTEQLDQGDVKALIQVVSSLNTRFESLAGITKQLAQENQILRAYIQDAEKKEERNTTQNDRPEQQSGEERDQHAMGADQGMGGVVRYASGPVRYTRRSTKSVRGLGTPTQSGHCSGPGCNRNDGTRSVYTRLTPIVLADKGFQDKVGIDVPPLGPHPYMTPGTVWQWQVQPNGKLAYVQLDKVGFGQ